MVLITLRRSKGALPSLGAKGYRGNDVLTLKRRTRGYSNPERRGHALPARRRHCCQGFNEGVVYEENGVRVTAFKVKHGEVIKEAYGFRVDYKGRSVVISGDTGPTENFVKYAQGQTW